jgi:hypothetical protein
LKRNTLQHFILSQKLTSGTIKSSKFIQNQPHTRGQELLREQNWLANVTAPLQSVKNHAKGTTMNKYPIGVGAIAIVALLVSSGVQAQTASPQPPATAAPAEKIIVPDGQPTAKMPDPAPANTDAAKAPLEGANSFTEAQAKQRLVDAGYTAVSTLAKDDRGVWRGTAMKAGKPAKVAVDFKGNVVQFN